MGQSIWGSLRTEDGLLKSVCSNQESTGDLQENSVKRVVGTRADHRNKRRKWMKRKAAATSRNHPPGIFQEKTEKQDDSCNGQQRKARPRTSLLPAPQILVFLRVRLSFLLFLSMPFLATSLMVSTCIPHLMIWSQASLCLPHTSICVSTKHSSNNTQPQGGSQLLPIALSGTTIHHPPSHQSGQEARSHPRAPSPSFPRPVIQRPLGLLSLATCSATSSPVHFVSGLRYGSDLK